MTVSTTSQVRRLRPAGAAGGGTVVRQRLQVGPAPGTGGTYPGGRVLAVLRNGRTLGVGHELHRTGAPRPL